MTNTETTFEVAEAIRIYNPRMAAMYLAQPFNRVSIAKAVAAGIKPVAGEHDYEMGATIIALAEIEREERLS